MKANHWCVYQDGWKQWGGDLAIGDGITAPSVVLVAICDTEEKANRLRDEIAERNKANHRTAITTRALDWPIFAAIWRPRLPNGAHDLSEATLERGKKANRFQSTPGNTRGFLLNPD